MLARFFSFFFLSRNLSSLSISDSSLPQAIGGVMSLASVVPIGIMSQVSQHFGYSEIQATFDLSPPGHFSSMAVALA